MADPVSIIIDSLTRFLQPEADENPAEKQQETVSPGSDFSMIAKLTQLAVLLVRFRDEWKPNGTITDNECSTQRKQINDITEFAKKIYVPTAISLQIAETAIDCFPKDPQTESNPVLDLIFMISPPDLRPVLKIRYAMILAKLDRFEEAKQQIAEAYSADPTLTDAHAQIGWTLFWPKKEYDKVIEWMEMDLYYHETHATQ